MGNTTAGRQGGCEYAGTVLLLPFERDNYRVLETGPFLLFMGLIGWKCLRWIP